MKYAWIKHHREEFSVALMCQVMDVSRSQYYAWLMQAKTIRDIENETPMAMINELFKQSRETYGTRRLKRKLAEQGWKVSRRRIGRLLKKMGLSCKTKRQFKATTDSKHKHPIAPNLLNRQFDAKRPDQYYVGDITYIATQEGWLYLAIVIDLFSRKVVGWSMAKHMRASLANDALLMALWSRKPGKGLIWHTDRGSRYASESHRALLKEHGVIQSMSRKGDCWDNAVSESFFHSLKTELIHHYQFNTREEARQVIFDYIEVFYNRQRLHSSIGYLSPVAFENSKLAT